MNFVDAMKFWAAEWAVHMLLVVVALGGCCVWICIDDWRKQR